MKRIDLVATVLLLALAIGCLIGESLSRAT